MKITAKKRDDILRQKDEYDKEVERVLDIQNAQVDKLKRARRDIFSKIEDAVLNRIPYKDDIDVTAQERYDYGIECKVEYGESRKFDEDVALSWHYTVYIDSDTNQIKKESSSWSGLTVTNPAAIENLKHSVENIEVLASINWEELLSVEVPGWDEYMNDVPKMPEKRDFMQELLEADIEDAIQSGAFVGGLLNSGKAYRGKVYYKIRKETPTQYEIEEVHESQIDDYIENNKEGLVYRIKKSNLRDKIKTPVEFYN